MEAVQALAFVARRAGSSLLEEERWRYVLSLELGWMPPGQAGRYIRACRAAGLLVEEGPGLRLAFDAQSVEIPRGFRPDPEKLPTPGAPAARDAPAAAPTAQRTAEPPTAKPPSDAPAEPPTVQRSAPDGDTSEGDLFATWLPKVAAARKEDIGATMAAVERQQEASGGLLHAEPALLRLGAEAGLDVHEAALQALKRLQA